MGGGRILNRVTALAHEFSGPKSALICLQTENVQVLKEIYTLCISMLIHLQGNDEKRKDFKFYFFILHEQAMKGLGCEWVAFLNQYVVDSGPLTFIQF